MSATPRELQEREELLRTQSKPVQSDTIPHGSKDREIESIKRTLYNAIDKLDRLTSK